MMAIGAPMPARGKPLLTYVVDSREQYPYTFGKPHRRELADGGTIVQALEEGDYACLVDGAELRLRVERKSKPDFFGVVGRGRDRFERELDRLKNYEAWLIIEATASDIRAGFERGLVTGEAAFASAIHWGVIYGVQVIFAGDRRTGQEICRRILEESAVHSVKR